MHNYVVSFFVVLIVFCGCQEKDKDFIVRNTIKAELEPLVNYVGIDSAIIVHIVPNHFDGVYEKSIMNALEKVEFTDVEKELIGQLIKVVNNPTSIRLNNFNVKNSIIFEDDSISVGTLNKVQEYNKRYIGTIIFSDPVVLNEEACYYLQINCGNNCSAGFLVFAKKLKGEWTFSRDQLVFSS